MSQTLIRPTPPASLLDSWTTHFAPAPDVAAWMLETFLREGAPLHNPDHAHLTHAALGVLWTTAENTRQMRTVLATAEMPPAATGKWRRGREEQQLTEWFGAVPDFLITLSTALATEDDRVFCAVLEHELYHCAQQRDAFGGPKFSQATGLPVFGLRGHDVEEFVGVVRRYGAGRDVQQLVAAAAAQPLLSGASIAGVCGNCLRVAA